MVANGRPARFIPPRKLRPVPESAYRTFRAFFDAVAEELPALLPGELRDYRTARMGGVFKVHFGTPRRHYELWFRGGGLEIGYHLEGAPEADRAVVAVLERRLPRLQRSLGGEMRLEPFGPGWSHLYELWPATAKTPRLAGDAAAGVGGHGNGPAVGLDDGGGDRQAQAGPAAAAGARGVAAVEPLEHPVCFVRWEPGSPVGHLDRGRTVRPRHTDGHRRRRRGVGAGVVEEVPDDLAKAELVAVHDDRSRRRELDGALGVGHAGVLHRVGRERRQVDRLALERPALVQPGQEEQVLD